MFDSVFDQLHLLIFKPTLTKLGRFDMLNLQWEGGREGGLFSGDLMNSGDLMHSGDLMNSGDLNISYHRR